MSDIASLLREAAEEILAADKLHGVSGERAGDLGQRLLAAAESLGEPVAWMTEHDEHPTQFELHDQFEHTPAALEMARQGRRLCGWRLTPLYLAPQPAVPEGWKLVPVEPTDEMIDAGADAIDGYRVDVMRAYEAMLAAAGGSHHE